jgi:hypothetical protein
MIFPLSAKNRFMQIGGRGHFVRWRQAPYRIDGRRAIDDRWSTGNKVARK